MNRKAIACLLLLWLVLILSSTFLGWPK